MKTCRYCDTVCEDSEAICPGCGASEFRCRCNNCGKIFDEGRFCPNCGIPVTAKPKKCPECGKVYYSRACPDCGYLPGSRPRYEEVTPAPRVQPRPEEVSPAPRENIPTDVGPQVKYKNKWIALLLCFFLGGLGAHKFYEGRVISGLLYLFTGGLFGIGWGLDILILLFKPNPYPIKKKR